MSRRRSYKRKNVFSMPSDYLAYWKFANDYTDETGNYDLIVQSNSPLTIADRNSVALESIEFNITATNNGLKNSTNFGVIGSDNITIATWVKRPSPYAAPFAFMGQGSEGDNGGVLLGFNGSRFYIQLATISPLAYKYFYSAATYSLDTYYHMLCQIYGSTTDPRLWINGSEVSLTMYASSNPSGITTNTFKPQLWQIGWNTIISTPKFPHVIVDSSVIYKRHLTSDEKTAVYEQQN